jgi:hypothetical protein
MSMTKQRIQRTASGKPSKSISSKKHKVVGRLSDGVAILAPKSKPNHFTSKEIRSTIQELRRNSATNLFSDVGIKRG